MKYLVLIALLIATSWIPVPGIWVAILIFWRKNMEKEKEAEEAAKKEYKKAKMLFLATSQKRTETQLYWGEKMREAANKLALIQNKKTEE